MIATTAARNDGAVDWNALYESDVFPFVERPSRYINREINSVSSSWDDAQLRVVLIFPDAYDVGISHLGLKLLYQVLNAMPGVLAERCYAPWDDAERIMRRKKVPLCSLETCHALCDFHIIGFSIQYELCYTNLLAILELGGVPLRSADRWGTAGPLVVAGGNVYSPGPLEPFVDAFAVGDGEQTVQRLAHWALSCLDQRRQFVPSEELFMDLVHRVPGIYVPALYSTTTAADRAHRVCATGPKSNYNVPFPIRKEIVRFDEMQPMHNLLVPFCEAIHDRAQVEIARGCAQGCRFCQVGMTTRPAREKRCASVVEDVKAVLAATGLEDVTLTALSATDHSEIHSILNELLDLAALPATHTSVALPSLRMDSFESSIAERIRRVRKTGFTFAPEAGSERLRRVINKPLTREEILKTVDVVFRAGWNLIKVYFMIGLPTETSDDIDQLADIASNIVRIVRQVNPRRGHVNISIASFVPKAFTPFQWSQFGPTDELKTKQANLRNRLPRRHVKIAFHRLDLSELEAVFARGDRQLANVVEAAYRLGSRFDDWSDRLDRAKWDQAFVMAGINPSDYLAPIPDNTPLPWEVIDCGVTREFLLRERHRALEAKVTEQCRTHGCVQCGVQRWYKCS